MIIQVLNSLILNVYGSCNARLGVARSLLSFIKCLATIYTTSCWAKKKEWWKISATNLTTTWVHSTQNTLQVANATKCLNSIIVAACNIRPGCIMVKGHRHRLQAFVQVKQSSGSGPLDEIIIRVDSVLWRPLWVIIVGYICKIWYDPLFVARLISRWASRYLDIFPTSIPRPIPIPGPSKMYCLQWLIPVLLIPKPVNPALLYNHAVLMVLYLTGFFLERKPCTICSVVFAVALALVWYVCKHVIDVAQAMEGKLSTR